MITKNNYIFKRNFLDNHYNKYNELRKYKDDYIRSSCFNFFQSLRVVLCVIIFHAKRETRISLRGKITKK